MRRRKAKDLAKQFDLLCPGHFDALRAMLEAADEVVGDGHAISGHEAWAHLWACLAHEINAVASPTAAPDPARFDAAQVEAAKTFARLLAEELEAEPLDYAGAIFMGLSFNSRVQIFTPREVVDFMIGSIVDAKRAKGERIGGLSAPWCDPCVGGGAFPLGVLRAAKKHGFEEPVWMVTNDLDPLCCDMAFVQYSYSGGLGEGHRGDFFTCHPAGDVRSLPLSHLSLPSKHYLIVNQTKGH